MIATRPRRKARAMAMIAQMQKVELVASSFIVDAMVTDYRRKFGLGPRDRANERATRWFGMVYEGRVVAVCGERLQDRRMEVTDAYYDGTRAGKVAFLAVLYQYLIILQAGEIDQLVHSALYANREHWEAIVRETGNAPYMLTFVHRRMGG